MSDNLYGKIVRDCQAMNKTFLKKKYDSKLHYPLHMQGHHVSIPSESQKTIPHCDLECDRRLT